MWIPTHIRSYAYYHIYILKFKRPFYYVNDGGGVANSVDPDQRAQNAESDLGL